MSDHEAKRSCVVVGGSSGVGRALVEQLAAAGDSVLAVARDLRDLESLQSDCQVRFGARVEVVAADLAAPGFEAVTFAEQCVAQLGHVSHLFLPVGAVDNADRGLPSPELLASLATVNYLRAAEVLTAFCAYFARSGGGHAVVFTSVAADAPRGHNAAYASAKKGLEFYCRALQHHFADSDVVVQICALGYVDTSMSFGASLKLPVASAEQAAQFAIRMSATRKRFSYFPRFWSPVIMLLKALPWSLYKRLRF